MAQLILVRHGQSQWNAKGLWTGLMDIPLSQDGIKEAEHTATVLKHIRFDIAFTSMLKRAQQTLRIILKETDQEDITIVKAAALNERDYGVYTGVNKWEVKEKIGEKEFMKLRRSWDYPIPKGETLKHVSERVYSYYRHEILPHLLKHQNVLVAAHGNSIRGLIKHLDNVPNEKVSTIEVTTGEADIYILDGEGNVLRKERRSVNKTQV
jgi:2,3-bisphosphoglycerate-dependent phosphoglycerate mutase